MAVIEESPFVGEIVWLGQVDPKAPGIRSTEADALEIGWDGTPDTRHSGRRRPACVRVKLLYDEATEIANTRQLSIVSEEEMAQIAEAMGIGGIDPAWVGASLGVRGIPDFTHIPPSSRLQGPDGATLVIDMLNAPCNYPAMEMNKEAEGMGKGFVGAARGRRGVTAWVERPGALHIGDQLRLVVPAQRAWAPQGR